MNSLDLRTSYLFLLGLASGLALLTATAYRHVSPRWLRWLLMATGVFVVSRYVAMAAFTASDAPQRFWALRHCWFATSLGLTLSSVFAVDQLIRHPAITPTKLLRYFSPFLIAYAAVILFGTYEPTPDGFVGGWVPRLSPGWQRLLSVTHGTFVLGFVGLCLLVIRKFPSRAVRLAVLGLVVAHLYLAADGVLLALGRSYFRPYLYSEMVALLALWHAYERAAAQ